MMDTTILASHPSLQITTSTRETNEGHRTLQGITQATPSSATQCSCRACMQSNDGTYLNNQVNAQHPDTAETEDTVSYSSKGLLTNKNNKQLSTHNHADAERELAAVKKLKERDTEVKAHEAAHLAAAGGLAQGGAKFTYQRGPDGQLYAIGGSVSIDIKPVEGNPKATIAKAHVIRAAALAPAEPSGQDQAVAATAAQMAQKAHQELTQNLATTGHKTTHNETQSNNGKSNVEHNGERVNSHSQTSSPSTVSSGNLSTEPQETITSSSVVRRLQSAITASQNLSQPQTLDIQV